MTSIEIFSFDFAITIVVFDSNWSNDSTNDFVEIRSSKKRRGDDFSWFFVFTLISFWFNEWSMSSFNVFDVFNLNFFFDLIFFSLFRSNRKTSTCFFSFVSSFKWKFFSSRFESLSISNRFFFDCWSLNEKKFVRVFASC